MTDRCGATRGDAAGDGVGSVAEPGTAGPSEFILGERGGRRGPQQRRGRRAGMRAQRREDEPTDGEVRAMPRVCGVCAPVHARVQCEGLHYLSSAWTGAARRGYLIF